VANLTLARPTGQGTPSEPIPEPMVAALEGAWNLGPSYRVVLTRNTDAGMTAQQEATVRLRGRRDREDRVDYDPEGGTVNFPGVGAIHPVHVSMRVQAGRVEYAVSTEIAPGKWTAATWEEAEPSTLRRS
jgi:hypothetical protein